MKWSKLEIIENWSNYWKKVQKRKEGHYWLNIPDREGNTLLTYATPFANIPILKTLINNGISLQITDKQGWTPLHNAVNANNEVVARFFIDNGADINAKSELNDGITPLILAVNNQNEKMIELIIESGADINLGDKNKITPLHKAIILGNENIVKYLLEKSVDITVRDNTNSTAILKAKLENKVSIQKLLINHFCKLYKIQTPSPFAKDLGLPLQPKVEESNDSTSTISTSSETTRGGGDTKYCKVCWENVADAVLLWCGHVTVCMFCSQYLQLCPICCAHVEKVQKVYIAWLIYFVL